MAGNFVEIRSIKRRRFLNEFARSGRFVHSCQVADMDTETHYKAMKSDPEYAAAFAEAREQASDVLEDEMIRRAVEGVEEPVFHQGVHIADVNKYSDTLLIFALKGAKPDKYKDRTDLTSAGKPLGVIEVVYSNGSAKSTDTP